MAGVTFRNSFILETTAPMIRHLFIYFPPSCLNNRHIGLSEVRQLPSTQGIAQSDRTGVSIHKHYFNVDSLTVNSVCTCLYTLYWSEKASFCWPSLVLAA
jgi:hypothetical protein